MNEKPAPISSDKEAIITLNERDYNDKISLEDAKAGLAHRKLRVYADGVYDMFHSGHARQLMQAKNAFPEIYLIVGVCNDKETNYHKGQTVMNENERYEAVRHCRYVDEVFTDAPFAITPDLLEKLKIDFVAHDDIPYQTHDSEDLYKFLKDMNIFLATDRTEGISTTDVIGRIVRDYDSYLRRNIKRGLSRQDLNISFVKEKSLIFQEKFDNLKQKGKHLIYATRKSIVDKWEEKSNDIVRSFTRLFEHTNWFGNKSIDSIYILTPGSSPIYSDEECDNNEEGNNGMRQI